MMSMKYGGLDPKEFDKRAVVTIPFYNELHENVIEVISHSGVTPNVWLDTGCGTGKLLSLSMGRFKDTEFIMADPMEGMLDIAKERSGERPKYICSPTDALKIPDSSVDVITAVLSHHYYSPEDRMKAESNCFRMLRPGGIFVTVENTAPLTDVGLNMGLETWKDKQMSAGRPECEADEHMRRYGTEFFPITAPQHIEQLKKIGFSVVELFRYTYMQAGFYAIK